MEHAKRIAGAIAAVVGFIGLATMVIFSVESAAMKNYTQPATGLAADIGANAPTDATDQTADANAVVTPAPTPTPIPTPV